MERFVPPFRLNDLCRRKVTLAERSYDLVPRLAQAARELRDVRGPHLAAAAHDAGPLPWPAAGFVDSGLR